MLGVIYIGTRILSHISLIDHIEILCAIFDIETNFDLFIVPP